MFNMKQILVTTAVFLIMDGLWLGFIAKNFYIEHMGKFLRLENGSITPNYIAAALVYIALIGGILIFVLPKAGGDATHALYYGAIFGLVCYATYDFTNLAVMENWPVWVSVVDVIWGAIICAVTSYAAALVR
jgi:uncharacterized membrane protein